MLTEQIATFLNIVLIENSWVFINLWGFIHLGAGFILMKYLLKNKKRRFVWLFALLVLYELFELYIISTGSNFFRPELRIDIVWDIIVGFGGAVLALRK